MINRNRLLIILIMLSALAILCVHLGLPPLWGSEGRWAVIARSMFDSGDIFNPLLGILPYWDKPLVSYWQILPFAYALGSVSETASRLPSVAWALVMLAITWDLAKRYGGETSALSASMILATTFGFVFWGRNAQAEMANAAVILVAIWYFLRHRHDQGHAWIFVLGACMAVGADLKGLTAIGVPLFSMVVMSALQRDWSWVPGLKHWPALILVCMLIFFMVPALACMHAASLEPLRLIWKENMLRFFQPFDHKDPFYVYGYRIFDLTAPWSLFLPPMLWLNLKFPEERRKPLTEILIIAGAIFVFFSLSGSRRPYYLLPIIPFSAIMIGDYLKRYFSGELPAGLSKITLIIGCFSGLLLAAPLAAYLTVPARLPAGTHVLLPWAVALLVAGLVMIFGFVKHHAVSIFVPMLVVWLVYAGVFIPWSAMVPHNIRAHVEGLKTMQRPVAFLRLDNAKVIYYLNRPYRIVPDLKAARAWAQATGGILITGRDDDLPDTTWRRLVNDRSWKAYMLGEQGKYPERTFNSR